MHKNLSLTTTSLLVLWLSMSVGPSAGTWGHGIHPRPHRWNGWFTNTFGGGQNNHRAIGGDARFGFSFQGSFQSPDYSKAIEQRLQAAFQVIQQGKQAEGQEMIRGISTTLARETSVTPEQKEAKLIECVKNVEKSLDKDTQVIAQQFLQGAQMGFKISIQNQAGPPSNSFAQGTQSTGFSQAIEQKLQEAFQAIQQGKQAQGQEMLKAIATIFVREQSLSGELKVAKFTECMKKIEKSLNKETQVIAEQFLQGTITAFKSSQPEKVDTPSGTVVQGSSSSVQIRQTVEQKLQAAFQAIQQGKQAEGREMLRVISAILSREQSINVEQKSTLLTDCVKKTEKSLNPETQVIAEQFLQGALKGFKVSPPDQSNTSTGTEVEGNSKSVEFKQTVEQKLQAAFEVIQQGNKDEGRKMLTDIFITFQKDQSITVEQKTTLLTECVKKFEKSFNKETQTVAEQFLKGALEGFKINVQGQTNSSAGTKFEGTSENVQFMQTIEQKLQAAFQAIQQGKQDQGREIITSISTTISQEKSITMEQKTSMITDCVKKVEKSFNKETQATAEQFLQGALKGFKINFQGQTNSSAGTNFQGSSQNVKFMQELEQKLQAAFQAIQQGKQDQGREIITSISTAISGEQSITMEQKTTMIIDCVKRLEKSFNKETQATVEQFLQGTLKGFKINFQGQTNSSAGINFQGSSQNVKFMQELEQKLQAAFQAIQQGKQDQGREIITSISTAISGEQSITMEQKTTMIIDCVKRLEKSFNKETQATVEQFLQGTLKGFKINFQGQTNSSAGINFQGSSQNVKFMQELEQKLQAAFQAIQQGKQDQGREIITSISTAISGEQSITMEQKTTMIIDCVKRLEKSFNKETQATVEQFLQGTLKGFKINFQGQTNSSAGINFQGSSQNVKFMQELEQKLQAAFQAIQQGKQDQGREIITSISTAISGEQSITMEQKTTMIIDCVKRLEKSFNKETQVTAEQFLQGALKGFKINFQGQTNSSAGTNFQGSSQNMKFMQELEQKLQAAFQAIQQGKQDQGREIITSISTAISGEQSITMEQKTTMITDCVKRLEKSFNKETQATTEQFLQGALKGFKINFQGQTNSSAGTNFQGSSQNVKFMQELEQKLQAAFQAIQQGRRVEGGEMLTVVSTILSSEPSINVEQKTNLLTECVKKLEKSLDKQTQATAQQFLQGTITGFKISHQAQGQVNNSSGIKGQGNSQSVEFKQVIEQKLQEAFQAIQQGKQAEGREMLTIISGIITREQSINVEQKTTLLTECVKKFEKSLNKETQAIAEQFLQGTVKGFNINIQGQVNTPYGTKFQRSGEFMRMIEQKLQAAFLAIQQGKQDEGREILTVTSTILVGEQSIPIGQKTAQLTEFMKRIEKSLDKDTQTIAKQFLQGALTGFKFSHSYQVGA